MKHFFSLLLLLVGSMSAFAQVVNIPDAKFKERLTTQNCAYLIGAPNIWVKVDSNNDGEIQISEALAVRNLNLSGSGITDISGLEYFTNITVLDCSSNTNLTVLDLSNLSKITELKCLNNNLSTLNISHLTQLNTLDCSINKITSLNLSNLPNLYSVVCSDNQLDTLFIFNTPNLTILYCHNNKLTQLDLSSSFKIREFYCYQNQIESLDFSQTPDIVNIICSNNKLDTIILGKLDNLHYLDCSRNKLRSVNINECKSIVDFFCSSNQIQNKLLVNDLPKLNRIEFSNNNTTNFELTNVPALEKLYCGSNQIESLDPGSYPNLKVLDCNNNKIKYLNVENNPEIKYLSCHTNLLERISIKNGTYMNIFYFSSNNELKHICCDEGEITQILNIANDFNMNNVVINTYCSFEQADAVHEVSGSLFLNQNDNECADSIGFPSFVKLKIQSQPQNTAGYAYTTNIGKFKLYFPEGSHTITPQLPNQSYFNIAPQKLDITVSGTPNPIINNFCIGGTETHSDVEIILMPTTVIRPGFQSTIKIVYQNLGNQLENGTIRFVFDDDRQDFISADITPASIQPGIIMWNFSNLTFFEKREILITLRTNSPTDNPSVNVGEFMSFTGEITIENIDATPSNNSFALRQTVVGSYDPNDKTCLQGERLDPDMVGEYVHYLIRFENTGTYPAEFVVVKDVINFSTFDLNTLEIIDASHPMYVRTSDGNVVEFIFENINLPFDDANNDGYVAFKIKTRPWLKIGDKLENSAAIYFDYNHPIITNTAQTVVAPLVDTYTPGDKNTIRLSPNPATNRVYFQSEQAITQVQVHSAEGRLLYSGQLQNNSLSLEGMAQGLYWVRVYSAEQYETFKLIKQ